MHTDRRGFLSRLIGGGATLTTLSALQAIAPETTATEIKRDRQYIFHCGTRAVPEEMAHHFEEVLRARGINAIVVAGVDLKILEVNQP